MGRWLIVLVTLLIATSAAAGPTKEEKSRAAAHFKQGKAFYDQAQWQSAIDEYEQAWKLVPQPLLQFNIGLAYERQGNLEEALLRYKAYLELEPKGQVSDEAREFVATLTPQVERIRAERAQAEADEAARIKAEADAAAKVEADRIEAERLATAETARLQAEEAERQRISRANAAERDRARSRSRLFTWSGIGAGAVGVAMLAVGVNFGLDARAADADLTGHTNGAWTQELIDREAAGDAANRNMMIFTIAGGASVIAGGVLFYLGRSAGERADRLAVVPGPGAGLGLAGAF